MEIGWKSRIVFNFNEKMKKSKLKWKFKKMVHDSNIKFSENLRNPSRWISKATELIFVAEILKKELISYYTEVNAQDNKDKIKIDNSKLVIHSAYLMLIAFAIENLCKAIIIGRKKKELESKPLNKIPGFILSHNLFKFVSQDLAIKLTVSEEELLERLTRNSEWDARYPIPTRVDIMKAKKTLSDGKDYNVAYYGSYDIEKIDRFLKKLGILIKNELGIII